MTYELDFVASTSFTIYFPNEDIQQIHYGETSATEIFNLLQKLWAKAH